MRKNISLILFALLLAAGPAFAQFEGVLKMKTTMFPQGAKVLASAEFLPTADGTGFLNVETPPPPAKEPNSGGGRAARESRFDGGEATMNVAFGKAGIRCEMEMHIYGALHTKMVMLQKTDSPNIQYHLNASNKTYTEIDVAKTREMIGQESDSKDYTVVRLDEEPILGYKTQHVLVKKKNPGNAMALHMWIAKDLLDYATFSKMEINESKRGDQEALSKALKDAGVGGLPLRLVVRTFDGLTVSNEVVKIDKKPLPASTFEIPRGYTKVTGGTKP
jgi:hypothetical protein